jgi:hypothetical protein
MFTDTTSAIINFTSRENLLPVNNNMPNYMINILEVSKSESAFNITLNPSRVITKYSKICEILSPMADGNSSVQESLSIYKKSAPRR